jgi:hypothetical protein
MTSVIHSVPAELHVDFTRGVELAEARHQQRHKDTLDHRSAVAACLTGSTPSSTGTSRLFVSSAEDPASQEEAASPPDRGDEYE